MKLIFTCIGFLMILEGTPYFISPKGVKDVAQFIQSVEEEALRMFGFILMLGGLAVVGIARLWLFPG